MDSGVLDKSIGSLHRSKPGLYAYLDIDPSADRETITHALQVRRSWAQGQQANPKYRQEALWVIKNIGLLKEALIAGPRPTRVTSLDVMSAQARHLVHVYQRNLGRRGADRTR